jgi:hypothetical protein
MARQQFPVSSAYPPVFEVAIITVLSTLISLMVAQRYQDNTLPEPLAILLHTLMGDPRPSSDTAKPALYPFKRA